MISSDLVHNCFEILTQINPQNPICHPREAWDLKSNPFKIQSL